MFYVYYDDGYYDDGDVGLEIKETEKQVADFILGRMAFRPKATCKNYTVIQGLRRNIEVVEVVKEIRLSQ